jgi:hypothetical protein
MFRLKLIIYLSICLSECLSSYLSTALRWALAVFSVSCIFYAVGRTPCTGDRPVARPLPTHKTTQTYNTHAQTSMPQVEFEPTIPAFEETDTVHTLEGAATVIGIGHHQVFKIVLVENAVLLFCSSNIQCVLLSRRSCTSWCWVSFAVVLCVSRLFYHLMVHKCPHLLTAAVTKPNLYLRI